MTDWIRGRQGAGVIILTRIFGMLGFWIGQGRTGRGAAAYARINAARRGQGRQDRGRGGCQILPVSLTVMESTHLTQS